MLSFAAINSYSLRSQGVWAACVAGIVLWTFYLDIRPNVGHFCCAVIEDVTHGGRDALARSALLAKVSPSVSWLVMEDRLHNENIPVTMAALHRLIGSERVATPNVVD